MMRKLGLGAIALILAVVPFGASSQNTSETYRQLNLFGEVFERVAAPGRVEAREQQPVGLDLDVASLGHLKSPTKGISIGGEIDGHLLWGLEVELVGVEAPPVRVLQRVAGLDAEQRLVGARVLVQ